MSEDNIRKQEEKDKAKAEILNGGSSGSEGIDPGTNNDPNEGTEVVNDDPAADGQETSTSEEVNNEGNPSQDTEENVSKEDQREAERGHRNRRAGRERGCRFRKGYRPVHCWRVLCR